MRYIGKEQALFIAKKLRDELIFNMAKAEGNSLTFAETASVIHGISVGGKRMSELNQIQNIRDGWDYVIDAVERDCFTVDKFTFIKVNEIVAREENKNTGDFRQKMVLISGTKYLPPQPFLLNDLFRNMLDAFHQNPTEIESMMNLFLDTARNQYFEDGNKRTGQLLMNGVFMREGYAPFTFAPEADNEFRHKLIQFYETGEKEGMRQFIIDQINEPRYVLMQEQPIYNK
ncbi:cell filamentation protein Fic [Pelistega sp. NLN82]|uniref:Cell filamentation protein Fic n=1 Tax=Pelistega ratti TaxID=2652177 RepID=A0A6L9Y644_9BURK|nr:Fic family protein [Pelistega ratti]NEN75851.1 cell filamentation protein Fic [Pelistega ratti]